MLAITKYVLRYSKVPKQPWIFVGSWAVWPGGLGESDPASSEWSLKTNIVLKTTKRNQTVAIQIIEKLQSKEVEKLWFNCWVDQPLKKYSETLAFGRQHRRSTERNLPLVKSQRLRLNLSCLPLQTAASSAFNEEHQQSESAAIGAFRKHPAAHKAKCWTPSHAEHHNSQLKLALNNALRASRQAAKFVRPQDVAKAWKHSDIHRFTSAQWGPSRHQLISHDRHPGAKHSFGPRSIKEERQMVLLLNKTAWGACEPQPHGRSISGDRPLRTGIASPTPSVRAYKSGEIHVVRPPLLEPSPTKHACWANRIKPTMEDWLAVNIMLMCMCWVRLPGSRLVFCCTCGSELQCVIRRSFLFWRKYVWIDCTVNMILVKLHEILKTYLRTSWAECATKWPAHRRENVRAL